MMLPILLSVIFIILLVYGAVIIVICLVILYPKVYSVEASRTLEAEKHHVDMSDYDRMVKEEVWINSPHGYPLFGIYLPQAGCSRTVILSHGITNSRYGVVKYIHLFRKRGFNVLLYDLRNHGLSGGRRTTFGYYEKDDLRAWVDWAFERLGPGGLVGVMGESLGAAVTLLAAEEDPRLSFCLADCPYNDFYGLLAYRLQVDAPYVPQWLLLKPVTWSIQRMSGMAVKEVSPLQKIARLEMPLFLAHGQADHYIPPAMSQALYEKKKLGICHLYLAAGARHAYSININPAEYDRRVGLFLKEAGFSEN